MALASSRAISPPDGLRAVGCTSYVPGGGPSAVTPFESNRETHSRARHLRKLQDYAEHPQLRNGHPTVHWMNETRRMASSVQAGARHEMPIETDPIREPVLAEIRRFLAERLAIPAD
jgi:alpha-beta hydrolase superfamily lysophospholipase